MTKPFQYKSYFMSIDFLKQTGDIIYSSDISFSQGDYGTSFIKFELKNDDKIIDLNGYRVVVSIVRKNMTKVVTESTIIDASNGLIEIPLTRSVLCIGTNQIEICLQKDQTQLISPIIPYKVTKSIGENSIEDLNNSNEYPILIQLIEDVKELKKSTESFLGEAQSSENIRKQNEATRVSQETKRQESMNSMKETFNSKIAEVNTAKEQMVSEVNNKITEVNNSKNTMESSVNKKIEEFENKFEELQNQNIVTEIMGARDGEESLSARLERDLTKGKTVYETVEGSNISVNGTLDSYLQNIEIKGNTHQNENNLADIKSVGDKVGEQELYGIPILCCSENLINPKGFTEKDQYNICYQDIKVKANKKYRFSYDGEQSNMILEVAEYDKNNSIIGGFTQIWRGSSIVTKSNTVKVRLKVNIVNINKVQMAEGDLLQYKSYQEHKLTILSPVPLDKIGDAQDRIIEKDGVWGVEKNIANKVLNEEDLWVVDAVLANTIRFRLANSEILDNTVLMSNKFKFENNYNEDSEHVYYANSRIWLFINKSNLQTPDVEGLKLYLKNNKVYIKYVTKNRQFIPLPDDQQIKLRTFANQTNISFLTELEGTIKADVPKSIGASVTSNTQAIQNLNEDLNKVKKLEEATALRVNTDKGTITCENTIKGRTNDVRLEGKSLVNILKLKSEFIGAGNAIYAPIETLKPLEVGKKYTLIPLNIPSFIKAMYLGDSGASKVLISYTTEIKPTTFSISSPLDISTILPHFYSEPNTTLTEEQKSEVNKKVKLVIIEGDYTKNAPKEYFEGIKSMGDDIDKLNIISSSRKIITFDQGSLHSGNATLVPSNTRITSKEFIKSHNGYTDIRGIDTSKYQIIIFDFDENYKYLGDYDVRQWSKETKVKLLPNAKYYKFCVKIDDSTNIFTNEFKHYITSGDIDVTNLVYKDEEGNWKKPILREWDTIEKHSDRKYYYHKRSFESIIDNNISISKSRELTDTVLFRIQSKGAPTHNDVKADIISSLFNTLSASANWNTDIEGISINQDGIVQFSILKSRLETIDETGIKKWLKANPIIVVQRSTQEEIYECTSIDMNTSDEETSFQVISNIPPKEFSFSLSNNIGNIVKDVQDDVKGLKIWKDKIENATTTTVITRNSFATVEETSNGYFDNIKLEGRTLKNIAPNIGSVTLNNSNRIKDITLLENISLNTPFTIGVNVTNKKAPLRGLLISFHHTDDTFKYDTLTTGVYSQFKTFTLSKEVKAISLYLGLEEITNDATSKIEFKELIVVKDTNVDTYFQGMKSVGDDIDEIVVLSCNENLFTSSNITLNQKIESDGKINLQDGCLISDFIYCKGVDNVIFNATKKPNGLLAVEYDNNKQFIRRTNGELSTGVIPVSKDCYYMKLYLYKLETTKLIDIKDYNISINVGSKVKPYTLNKTDKKKVLYYDTESQTWKKPVLREWDSIEKHDNDKYYYHKRSIEKTVNGNSNENWVIRNTKENTILFGLSINENRGDILSICDKVGSFNSADEGWRSDTKEGVYVIDYIHLNILKSKANNTDELKRWLQSNPLTIVYKAETEKVYECTPIDLMTFENETSYMIGSGAIIPKTTLKCQNYIGNVINTLKEKVSYLEDKLYQTGLANFTVALNTLDTKLKLEQLTKVPK